MKKTGFFLGIVAAVLFSFSANAASVIPMALDELVASADTIVVARCTDTKSYWQDNKIVTDNLLDIEQTIKGEAAADYVVTTLGGTALHPRLKAPVNMTVPGGARFDLNEEVLLFTRKNAQGIHQIVGFTQGKLTIETDEVSGKKVIPVGQKKVTNQPSDADSLDLLFSPFTVFESHQTKIQVRKIELPEMISKIEAQMAKQ